MNSETFVSISATFFIFLCWFGHSKNNSILAYIYKVVNRRWNCHIIFISQINLSLFGPILEMHWCQFISDFLFRFLQFDDLKNSLSVQFLEENNVIMTQFLMALKFLIYTFQQFFIVTSYQLQAIFHLH